MATRNLILTKEQTNQKIRRIAHEIYEQNYREDKIVFAGIYDKGYLFGQLLLKEFNLIASNKGRLVKISLDKFSPLQSEITLDCDINELQKSTVILLDDVLNTGRTLAYSLKPFLNIEIKKLQTAVIVDRGYKNFPISADYVGYALSTSLQEVVDVVFNNGEIEGVYLE